MKTVSMHPLAEAQAQKTLRASINEVLTLERDIQVAVDQQAGDASVALHRDAAALIHEIAYSTDARVAALYELSEHLGSDAGAAKNVIAASALSGIFGKGHKQPVSRMLRDDYTALALAATAYSMLYTTAVALHDGHIAAVTNRLMRDVTPLVMELSRVIPDVVLHELADDFADVNYGASEAGREATIRAWSQNGGSD